MSRMGFDLCPDSAAHSQMVVWEWSEITPKEPCVVQMAQCQD